MTKINALKIKLNGKSKLFLIKAKVNNRNAATKMFRSLSKIVFYLEY